MYTHNKNDFEIELEGVLNCLLPSMQDGLKSLSSLTDAPASWILQQTSVMGLNPACSFPTCQSEY